MFLNHQNNITDEFTNLIYSNYYTVYWGSWKHETKQNCANIDWL